MRLPNTVFNKDQLAGFSWSTKVSFNKDGRCYASVMIENCGESLFEGWVNSGKVRRGSVTVWLFNGQGQILSTHCSGNFAVALGHHKVVPWHFNVPVINLEQTEKVAIIHSTDSASLEITVEEARNRAQLVQ